MTKTNHQLQYLIFCLVYLTGCTAANGPVINDGQAFNLYHGTAQWIIDGCMNGECGSQIFVKDNLVVYARAAFDNVAFVVTDKGIPVEKLSTITGNLVNCATWACFKEWLINNGFAVVNGGAPAYRLIVEFAKDLASYELVPIFSIMTSKPNQLPVWVVGSQEDL